jgi:hypothetical protein
MIQFTVNVTNNASPALRAMLSGLTGPKASDLSEQGGIAARNAAVTYHREFDQSGGWRGKRYLGPSQNDGSSFGADVARGWSLQDFDRSGATIANDAAHYAFKVSGGTITPKRANNLTIPLIAEARGLYASVYQQNTGRKLFKSPSGKALMEKTESGGVRAVYALVKSITMGPWPGAVPPEEVISDAFTAAYRNALIDLIDES